MVLNWKTDLGSQEETNGNGINRNVSFVPYHLLEINNIDIGRCMSLWYLIFLLLLSLFSSISI